MRISIYILMICVLSSCAIHNKFPFVCFRPGCVIKQFSIKPLKKKIQMALGKKKKRHKTKSNSKKRADYPDRSEEVVQKVILTGDSLVRDSVIYRDPSVGSLAAMDTVLQIYYLNLNDSILRHYKQVLKSFITRTGTKHISEVSLTDFYSESGTDDTSIKQAISEYLMENGISKHRLFWRKERVKTPEFQPKTKNLLYLEIRFH